MRFTNGFANILAVNRGSALLNDLWIAMMKRLASASDTTARTGHDLDGMEQAFSGLNILEQFACIAESVGNADIDRQTIEIKGRMTDILKAAQFIESTFSSFLPV